MSEYVKIVVKTGFVGCVHEHETLCTADEWAGLSNDDKQAWIDEAVYTCCEVTVETQDGEVLI